MYLLLGANGQTGRYLYDILTKAGKFYARVDLQHQFPNGTNLRFSVPSEIEILWQNESLEYVTLKRLCAANYRSNSATTGV